MQVTIFSESSHQGEHPNNSADQVGYLEIRSGDPEATGRWCKCCRSCCSKLSFVTKVRLAVGTVFLFVGAVAIAKFSTMK